MTHRNDQGYMAYMVRLVIQAGIWLPEGTGASRTAEQRGAVVIPGINDVTCPAALPGA